MHFARAAIVIKFPGTPTIINNIHEMDANIRMASLYSWNNSTGDSVDAESNVSPEIKIYAKNSLYKNYKVKARENCKTVLGYVTCH